MNSNEKILAGAVGAILLLLLGYGGFKAIFLKPIREIDGQTALLRDKLDKLRDERRRFFVAEDYLNKKIGGRLLADQPDQAAARAGELLTQAIHRAGLKETDFSRMPAGMQRLPGATQVGWTLQGEGPFPNVLDLLFILEKSPPLHRLEGLTLIPSEKAQRMRIRFRYLTLALEPAPDVAPLDPTNYFAVNDAERARYQIILRRNLLAPHIPPAAANGAAPVAAAPSPAGPDNFRIVSLSDWMGQPEVHVLDIAKKTVQRFHPGDALAGGVIVQVDYRPWPWPGNSGLLSTSRVLIKIGAEYWAIEEGQTLADKRRVSAEDLPENLRPDRKNASLQNARPH